MLNIFFSLFLLGMLVVLCGKAIRRAMHQQQPLNSKEAALLIALSLGCLFALNAGVSAVYKTTKPSCFSTEKSAAWLPQMRQLFCFTQKRGRQQTCASLFASYAAILFFVLSQKNPH